MTRDRQISRRTYSAGAVEIRPMIDVLPCPFCAQTDMTEVKVIRKTPYIARVACGHCNVQGPLTVSTGEDEAMRLAVASWNKRGDA